jgi:hypothetical protein
MATFYAHMEEITPISSQVIETLKASPGVTEVQATMRCLRHSRFKTKRTTPHFYVIFRQFGCTYSENASSTDELDALIKEYL